MLVNGGGFGQTFGLLTDVGLAATERDKAPMMVKVKAVKCMFSSAMLNFQSFNAGFYTFFRPLSQIKKSECSSFKSLGSQGRWC